MNQPKVALSPAVEMKLSPLIRQGKPACPTILAIGTRAESGPSGTGKTLAAAVIARIGKPVIPVPASTYIGETEKNLNALIDRADRTGAILLFDEADALFGKRGEVKDSHDRYANQELSYLLSVLGHRGIIAILIGLRAEQPRTLTGNRYTWVDLP